MADHERDAEAEPLPSDPEVGEGACDAADVEARLEELAEEMSRVVGSSSPEERDALHDYAVSLVRDQLPVADDDERFATPVSERGGPTRAGGSVYVGYGFLLLLVGLPMLPVFGPIGAFLVVVAVMMMAAGAASAFFERVRSGGASSAD